MSALNKYRFCFIRDYLLQDSIYVEADDEYDAEGEAAYEFDDFSDFQVDKVSKCRDGKWRVDFSYWNDDQEETLVWAKNEEEAVEIFKKAYKDTFGELFEINKIEDLGSDIVKYMADLEKLGQMTFSFAQEE